MPNLQAISRQRHANRYWRHNSTGAPDVNESVAALAGAELPAAMMALPLGFIAQGDEFVPAAILGLQPGKNLFIARSDRWIGNYIPLAFRVYPFRLAPTQDGQKLLCVDEDSGLVGDGPAGERFFGDDGQPTKATLAILKLLTDDEHSRLATAVACATLHKHGLIRPWPITVTTDAGDHQVTGLFQIDETALNALSGEALSELLRTGALPIAYCQMISMQHMALLGQLTSAHAKAAAHEAALRNLAPKHYPELDFLNRGETINFGGLGT